MKYELGEVVYYYDKEKRKVEQMTICVILIDFQGTHYKG